MTEFAELKTQVIDELSAYGIGCTDDQASLLVRHLLLVIEKNKVVNLTRITDEVDGISMHVVDSLLPLACFGINLGKESSFVDIGTGAGFPGVPLGIISGAKGLLLDSVGKKVNAVNEFVKELGVSGLRAVHTRVEDLPRNELGNKTHVFARAVAQSNVLIEYAAPLLKKGGLLVLEKANPTDEELEHARAASDICGLEYVSRETFELPRGLGHREILIFEKVARPLIKLPRKAGTAKHDPLGE